jgi:hypothetical protein
MQNYTMTIRGSLTFGSEFKFISERTGNNNDLKILEITGDQFASAEFESIPGGFRLSFRGNTEEQDFFQVFKIVSEARST